MDGVLIDTEKWLNKYWRQAAAEAAATARAADRVRRARGAAETTAVRGSA